MEATYDAKIQDALTLVEAEEKEGISDQITFSNGVVLKLKKVNILRIQAVMDKFKYPEVPMVFDENKGRGERNPNDPFYLKKIEEINVQRSLAVLDAIAALGTEPLIIPDTVPQIDDPGWIEECQLIGIEVNTEPKIARYLSWVKYVAVVDTNDFIKIGEQFGVTLGISEARVAEQLRTNFPDNEIRDTTS